MGCCRVLDYLIETRITWEPSEMWDTRRVLALKLDDHFMHNSVYRNLFRPARLPLVIVITLSAPA